MKRQEVLSYKLHTERSVVPLSLQSLSRMVKIRNSKAAAFLTSLVWVASHFGQFYLVEFKYLSGNDSPTELKVSLNT